VSDQPDHVTLESYDGPGRIGPTEVSVRLRGHFEPIDGRFHWWGRVGVDETLTGEHDARALVTLTTPHGEASGRLSDVDPWGRFRITGTGRPPF
jgi:hypothetical protein